MASILGKKPFVDKILSSCSDAQLSLLQSLINNPGSASIVYLYGNDRLLSNSNIGVSYVQLMIDEYSRRYLNGFLVYVDNSHCGFFSFSNLSSHLIEIEINPVTLAYTDIYENLSAEEFRRTVADLVMTGGDGTIETFEIIDLVDLSGTLSADDLAKAKKDNCLIKVSTQYYYKEMGGQLLRYSAFTRKGNDSIIMEKITIDGATGEYEYVSEVIGGGSGTKLYKHIIYGSEEQGEDATLTFISNIGTAITNVNTIINNFKNGFGAYIRDYNEGLFSGCIVDLTVEVSTNNLQVWYLDQDGASMHHTFILPLSDEFSEL